MRQLIRWFLRPSWIELLGMTAVVAGLTLAWLPLGIIIGGIMVVFLAQGLRR